jgi:hypothetical protein
LKVARVGIAVAAAFMVMVGISLPASAHLEGAGCAGVATDTNGKANPATVDFATTDVWTVSKDSFIKGSGTTPHEEAGSAYGVAFGYPIPIQFGGGEKGTFGSATLNVADFSKYARVIGVAGSSASCSGYMTLVIGDVSAIDTIAGKAVLGAMVFGLLGVAALALRAAK